MALLRVGKLALLKVTPNPGHSASMDLQILLIQFMSLVLLWCGSCHAELAIGCGRCLLQRVQLRKCFCAPLLYQAFLEIGLLRSV